MKEVSMTKLLLISVQKEIMLCLVVLVTLEMKKKLGVTEGKPLADFLPTLTLKAKDFAAELTSHNVTEKDLKGEQKITKEHIDNNLAVRKMLLERGVKPENLPPAEDISKVKRRLESEENKVEKEVKKVAAKNKNNKK